MPKASSFSIVDKLLVSAYNLEMEGKSGFFAEDLVVRAWSLFPDTFGLRGYLDDKAKPKYPDSNRVFAEIMGSKPIRKRGLLVKIGTKKYQLTESGRELALLLLNRRDNEKISKATLPRAVEAQIVRLLESRVAKKMRDNRFSEVTFFDASNFWGITARSQAIELEGRLAEIQSSLDFAKQVIGEKSVSTEHGGRGKKYSALDLEFLKDLDKKLQDKFKSELSLIRERQDQRRRK